MTDRELMQQALDYLDAPSSKVWAAGTQYKIIQALRARLANEFDPDWDVMAVMVEEQQRMAKRIEELEAALAQPEQRSEQWWKHEVSNAYANGYEKGRASVKQPEQEPVAWIYSHKGQKSVSMNYVAGVRAIPLYTAPPQREWKGLTDEEIWKMDAYRNAAPYEEVRVLYLFARAIEAKLKEKNGTS